MTGVMCETAIQTMAQRIESSPYRKVYWFARFLVNGDKFGGLGNTKADKVPAIITNVEALMVNKSLSKDERFRVAKRALISGISDVARDKTIESYKLLALANELDQQIETLDDLAIFCFTAKYVVLPVTNSQDQIPSNDEEFSLNQARAILDELGESGVGKAIQTWDKLGEVGCLDTERTVVMEQYETLIHNLNSFTSVEHSKFDDDLVTTAFMQEFERRLGQTRAGRAGRSLESAVDLLFNYYNIPSTTAPDHLESNLEVDKWFACGRQGWKIGISCKRTVRERWKNLKGGRGDILSDHKIREIWHIVTYDADVTDNKVTDLGRDRQYFYFMDDSPRYADFRSEPGTANLVRPLSRLIQDIRDNRAQ